MSTAFSLFVSLWSVFYQEKKNLFDLLFGRSFPIYPSGRWRLDCRKFASKCFSASLISASHCHCQFCVSLLDFPLVIHCCKVRHFFTLFLHRFLPLFQWYYSKLGIERMQIFTLKVSQVNCPSLALLSSLNRQVFWCALTLRKHEESRSFPLPHRSRTVSPVAPKKNLKKKRRWLF